MKRDHFRLSGGTSAEGSVTNMRSDSPDFGYPVEIRSPATYRLAFAAVVTLAAWRCLPATSQEEAPERAPLKALAFLSGHWRGELDGALTDDFWSKPEGDSIIGMYREIQAGKVTMYELLSIEQTGDGPVLLIKHFNPGLRAWEEKDHGVILNLTHVAAGEAVFQRPDRRLRLTFRLVSKDVLETTLEEIRNGKPTTTVFREKRSD